MLVLFYADDGVLASIDAAHLQSSQDILVGLFERVGFNVNTTKAKVAYDPSAPPVISFITKTPSPPSPY